MLNFQTINNLIKEKIEQYQQANQNSSNINPFYVTYEETVSFFQESILKDTEISKLLPNFEVFTKLFHLNSLEEKIILLILLPEIDSRYKRVYAFLQNDLNKNYPTISLISSLLTKSAEEKLEIFPYFSKDFPLYTLNLIKFYDQEMQIEENVKDFIFGFSHLDNKIQIFSEVILYKNELFQGEDKLFKNIQTGLSKQKRFIIHYHGGSSNEKRAKALEIASKFGVNLIVVNTQIALTLFDSIEELLKILYRDATLFSAVLYFEKFDAFFAHQQYQTFEFHLFQTLERLSWLTFFDAEKEWKPKSFSQNLVFIASVFKTLRYPESIQLWKKHLAELDTGLAKKASPALAQQFQFSEDEIAKSVYLLKSLSYSGENIDKKTIYNTCRKVVSTELNGLAQPVHTANTLKDIVLPKDQKAQLQSILSHYKYQLQVFENWGFKKHYQSQGIGVLFTGPPGTGKTMAASIIANELELDLYRIELSQVVSKYIGETEKNLSKIFNAAEGSGVVLFFDEADAIFGKRTETKDSHDRYANIEVSYLLQKIEEYDGLVLLASNFRKNIDDAFVRRMRFIINFPFPDQEMREKIWQKVFPKTAPLDKEVTFSYLAKNFTLSGANIRNSALFAAFFAAEKQESIQMKHISEGLKIELLKMGKTYKTPDFTALLR